jgi:hypothetical protein
MNITPVNMELHDVVCLKAVLEASSVVPPREYDALHTALDNEIADFQHEWKGVLTREDALQFFDPSPLPQWFVAGLPPLAFCVAMQMSKVAQGFPSEIAAAVTYRDLHAATLLKLTFGVSPKTGDVRIIGAHYGKHLSRFTLGKGDYLYTLGGDAALCVAEGSKYRVL